MQLWAISVRMVLPLLLEVMLAIIHFGFSRLVMMMREVEISPELSLSDFDLSITLNCDFEGII